MDEKVARATPGARTGGIFKGVFSNGGIFQWGEGGWVRGEKPVFSTRKARKGGKSRIFAASRDAKNTEYGVWSVECGEKIGRRVAGRSRAAPFAVTAENLIIEKLLLISEIIPTYVVNY